jgi:hypothetical protein
LVCHDALEAVIEEAVLRSVTLCGVFFIHFISGLKKLREKKLCGAPHQNIH